MSSSSTDHDERVDAAIAEWLEAREQGQALNPAEFLARYPDLADDLRIFLADENEFARAATRIAPGASPDDAPAEGVAGQCLGDFVLRSEIGRGGMGIVYEALQVSLNRRVALKVLHAGRQLDPRSIVRFRQEAEAAASLTHPNLVPIYATGEEAGVYYYAMELIEGPSLDRLLRAGDRQSVEAAGHPVFNSPPATSDEFNRIARIMSGAAAALHYAHERGVIHRDVKPSNLLLAADGTLRVGDFGLARFVASSGITFSAEIVGSPAYMSPEQAAGAAPLDRRTDVYSLGTSLYELLAGRPPFRGERRDELLLKVVHEDPPPPRRW